jgi:hypothetical protein
MQHGDMTYLVCLDALFEACHDLEAHTLATIREALDQVLDLACQQQSFAPLNKLFDEEEAALAIYEQAVAKVREAEVRWSALCVAFAYEKERMLSAQSPLSRMN